MGISVAPIKDKTLAVRFFDKVRGTQDEKCSAYHGFRKWPRYFGHTQKEIYDLIDRETAGTFNVRAFNGRTQARGLTQVRYIALEDIVSPPDGKSFFRYKNITDKKRIKLINRHITYRPYYNLYGGCAYYALCKSRARSQHIGRFKFSREEMAKLYYVSGIGTWNRSFKPTLEYIQ